MFIIRPTTNNISSPDHGRIYEELGGNEFLNEQELES